MPEYMIRLLILLVGTFAVSANEENGQNDQTDTTNNATTTSATVTVNITTSQNNQTTTISPEKTTSVQGNITVNATVALTTTTSENVTNGNNTLNVSSTVAPNTAVTTSNVTTTTGVEISNNTKNPVTSQSSTSETMPDVQTTASPSNTTELEPTTAKNTEVTTQNTTESGSTADPEQTIVEKVKAKWAGRVAETNFNSTALNETGILEITPSEVIDVIIDYYKSFLESEKVSEIAEQILKQKPSVLETYITENFNATQNISLHGFLAALYWLDEEVLGVNQSFPILISRYGDDILSNDDNSTSENVTTEGFIRFILSNASAVDLFGAICKAADGINDTICPTTAPPTVVVTPAPLPGPEKFQSTWDDLVTASNYEFLSSEQKDELKSVTPVNMTTALIDYVKNMDSTEIKKLVDANATIYVSSVLRSDGSAVAILGQEAITAFGGDETREDVYYIYLNFMNNIFSQSGMFEIILRGYISASSLARATPICDTSKITAPGVCCYTITTQAQNQTVLRDSICAELNGGSDCISSFVVEEDDDEPTSQPVTTGLSTGAIVGITLGAIAVCTLFFILIFLLWKRCNKKNSKINPEDGDTNSDDMELEGRRSSQTRPQVRSRTNGQLTGGDEPSTP